MIDGRRCHVERMKINDTHLFFCLFLYRLSTAVTKIQLHCMGYALLEKTNRKGKHVIVIPKNITHSILLFLTSKAYYTPNATSSFQLYRINLGDVQTNHGPTNNKQLPNYPSKECG